uniref:Uncharacterized protein n=1 Tax=Vespula pensylvanica TaxID=30213 RepID=A0A834MYR0_VESPE|nr:hypothetical protein H0235_017949 [Vespula pensylvanica]
MHSPRTYIEQWGYFSTRDDNKVRTLTDFDSYWFSLALNFNECASRTSRSRDTFPPMTITRSELCPTLSVTSPVWICTSTRELRNFHRKSLENSDSALSEDFDNISPGEDLEIFAPLRDFDNLSPGEDLEIFAPSRDFDNNYIEKWGYFHTRDGNKVGSLFDFDSYWTSLALNFDKYTTGRVPKCLKPTVWTVEHSVSGVLHISSLLRSSKLPKRKGISDRGF